jgi:hypothetical protein
MVPNIKQLYLDKLGQKEQQISLDTRALRPDLLSGNFL